MGGLILTMVARLRSIVVIRNQVPLLKVAGDLQGRTRGRRSSSSRLRCRGRSSRPSCAALRDYFLDLAMPDGQQGEPSNRLTFPGD